MPAISIPETFKPSLNRIADMSPEELKKVQEALAVLKARIKPEIASEQAKAISTSSGIADFQDLYEALISLSITRFRADVPMDDFVREVSASIKKKDQPDLRAKFEERLKELLAADSLAFTARAFDLQHEYEKVLLGTRIVTDIRPLFDVPATKAVAAMIVHNLTVTYFEDGKRKETVFAMDNADLAKLKKAVERAQTKTKLSEKLIEKAELQYLDSK